MIVVYSLRRQAGASDQVGWSRMARITFDNSHHGAPEAPSSVGGESGSDGRHCRCHRYVCSAKQYLVTIRPHPYATARRRTDRPDPTESDISVRPHDHDRLPAGRVAIVVGAGVL